MFTAVKAGVRNEVLKAVGQMGGSAANDVTELNVALARFFKQHTANMQFTSQVQVRHFANFTLEDYQNSN